MKTTKFIKISVSERLPKELESVFTLHDKDNWLSNGYVDLSNMWFDDSDEEVEIFPTHWLEEVEDKSGEILEILEKCLKHMNVHSEESCKLHNEAKKLIKEVTEL